jgi:hypothetical protein
MKFEEWYKTRIYKDKYFDEVALDAWNEARRTDPVKLKLVADIKKAMEYSGGRWCEWGERAEKVRDILEDARARAEEENDRCI